MKQHNVSKPWPWPISGPPDSGPGFHTAGLPTPNLPTNITPTNIAWIIFSGKFPTGLGIPPLNVKIMIESNPLKSSP